MQKLCLIWKRGDTFLLGFILKAVNDKSRRCFKSARIRGQIPGAQSGEVRLTLSASRIRGARVLHPTAKHEKIIYRRPRFLKRSRLN